MFNANYILMARDFVKLYPSVESGDEGYSVTIGTHTFRPGVAPGDEGESYFIGGERFYPTTPCGDEDISIQIPRELYERLAKK